MVRKMDAVNGKGANLPRHSERSEESLGSNAKPFPKWGGRAGGGETPRFARGDRAEPPNVRTLELLLGQLTPAVARAIDGALSGHDLSIEDAVTLFDCTGADMQALVLAADALRREQVGDVVTYVVNRNVNWTNICFVGCKFCAFAHLKTSPLAYDDSIEMVI